jgi:hypothetical protein
MIPRSGFMRATEDVIGYFRWGISLGVVVSVLFLLSCSAPKVAEKSAFAAPDAEGAEGAESLVEPSASSQTRSPPSGSSGVATNDGATVEEGQSEATSGLAPTGVFPPPDPGPPFERSAHEGDGKWREFFEDAGEPSKKGRLRIALPEGYPKDLAFRMVLHPHEESRFQRLAIAAFDLAALRISHRPGLQDVKDMNLDELADRAGLVPEAEHSSLFAVFNEGFQPRHGRWGMFSLDTQIVPPRADACTVAIFEDGTVGIAPWPEIEGADLKATAYRQTPPCLIVGGEIHPRLLKADREAWAGQNEKLRTLRRSAVGLSEDRRTLYFAVGQETEAEVLAAGLRHAGAFSAAQLDINWNWTRLFLFAPVDGEIMSLGSLEEDMAKDRGEYVRRPGARGFFYLTRRPG